MEIRIKKFISFFLITLIGFTGIGSDYFLESCQEIGTEKTKIVSYSDLIPEFDQGLEFSQTNIHVPGFKVLETVFDLVNVPLDFLFSHTEHDALKVNWLQRDNLFFSIHIFLYPFHYFW
ncbi:hypothetical protein [Aquiflexum gelatinilyticum]|uniref:hypothetical protein n=1 Tax=Aquiflexum gelatinilyticum TaxID=2961943 RepID=UPI0021692E51|nr:hypothetical protein [Aquiflexum gelatinilyticum]MCS4435356.1 hypothetical protein [Aquiflexum gelatinilyticum]